MAINALIGGTSSNSYITVDQADALYLDTFQNEKWVALSTEQKEIALISATLLKLPSNSVPFEIPINCNLETN